MTVAPTGHIGLRVVSEAARFDTRAQYFAESMGVPCVSSNNKADLTASDSTYLLHFSDSGVFLSWFEGKKSLNLKLDFIAGANRHRRKFGGGKSQMLAKAVGIQSKFKPCILDCTAGQAGDAFVFAGLGCQVRMLERSPIAHLLLEDALRRAAIWAEQEDSLLADILQRMELVFSNALDCLDASDDSADVIYIDPMFPERKKKTALVKKEMRVFHDLIGGDEDADSLLGRALEKAQYRVVVKRPRIAPFLGALAPTYQLSGRSTRFDIYALKRMPAE